MNIRYRRISQNLLILSLFSSQISHIHKISTLPEQVVTYHIVFWYLRGLPEPLGYNSFNLKEDSSWHTSVSVPISTSSEALAIARPLVSTVGKGWIVGVLGVAAMRDSVPGSLSINQDSATTTSTPSTSIASALPSSEVEAFDRDVFETDTASLSSSNTSSVPSSHPAISSTVPWSSSPATVAIATNMILAIVDAASAITTRLGDQEDLATLPPDDGRGTGPSTAPTARRPPVVSRPVAHCRLHSHCLRDPPLR